jgi:2-methylisocitrate lyase-like PEP mutase family enzyme
LADKATTLLALHQPVILPTVWDAWSAWTGHPEKTSRFRRIDRRQSSEPGRADHRRGGRRIRLWAIGVAADRGAARSRRSAAEHRRHCAQRRQATAFDSDRVERAVARLQKAAAGADVLYPVDRHDPETLRRLTSELPLPANAIALTDQDDPASLDPLGIGRISFGPFLQSALGTRDKEILARWG